MSSQAPELRKRKIGITHLIAPVITAFMQPVGTRAGVRRAVAPLGALCSRQGQAGAAGKPGVAEDVLQIDREGHEQQPGEGRGGPGHPDEQVVQGSEE